MIYKYTFKRNKELHNESFTLPEMTNGTAVKKIKSLHKNGWMLLSIKRNKMKQWVNVGISVMIEKDGKLLMGRRTDKNWHGVHTWCTPGGHIEFNEELEDTCKREVFEEVGIKIKDIKFMGITNDIFRKEKMHYVTLFFSAEYKSGKIKSTPELDKVDWYDKKHLPTPLFLCMGNYLKKIIRTER